MVTRFAKMFLLCGIALFYTLVVFNNITDFGSNYQFVNHVLNMDTTFPNNHGMWRALHPAWTHLVFYIGIIAWEAVTAVLLWWGAARLYRARLASPPTFTSAKRMAVIALTLSLMMWLVAFLTVGAEWFLMWQSTVWNGQEAAFRMFVVVAIVLLIVMQLETAGQP
jgi:predicted small integral membrane protein